MYSTVQTNKKTNKKKNKAPAVIHPYSIPRSFTPMLAFINQPIK